MSSPPKIEIVIGRSEGTRYHSLEVNGLNYGNHAHRSTAVAKADFLVGVLLDLQAAGTLPALTIIEDIKEKKK